MDSVNVNVGNRYKSSKKNSISDNSSANLRVGDNLFSLMLISIAALGVWAISAVLFF